MLSMGIIPGRSGRVNKLQARRIERTRRRRERNPDRVLPWYRDREGNEARRDAHQGVTAS